ncbi:MAG TPA: hypothetical protein VF953_00185 [Terriglobales bacterium]|jgi:hypothetical protein
MRSVGKLALCLALLGPAVCAAFGQTSAPAAHHDVVIKNAVVYDGDPRQLQEWIDLADVKQV